MEIKRGEATVSKTNPDKTVEEERITVGEDRLFDEPPCNVGMSSGFTLPDKGIAYANTKVSVSLFVPCAHDEVEETYEFVKNWVSEKSNDLYDEVMELSGYNEE